jgi:putative aldouronate transport system permease protein
MNLAKFKREIPLYTMVLPAVILVLIYNYIPMAGIVIAFQNFNPAKGFLGSEFIGLENFRYMLDLPDIFRVLYNTIYIASMKIILMLLVPVIITLLLNECRGALYKKSVQTIVYLPHFLSWVILGGIIVDILSPSSGILNQFLQWVGIKPIYFLADNKWFPIILVFTDTWKEFGFGTIIYLAALTGIDPCQYEAAVIDGANRWKQTIHITIPGILPIVILMTCLSLGNILNAGFDQVFNLYNPTVYESGDIIDTLVYRIGLIDAQYSVGTAVGLFKSVISLIMLSVSYKLADKFAGYRIF